MQLGDCAAEFVLSGGNADGLTSCFPNPVKRMRTMGMPLPRTLSISTKAAAVLSIVIGLLFVVSGWAAYADINRQALNEALVRLDSHNQQVSELQEGRFTRLRSAHEHAKQLLLAELAEHSQHDNAHTFDVLFPRDPRGGRRSADLLFDGGRTPYGHIRGVGAFVGVESDKNQPALILSAARVAHAVGEGIRPDLKSLYFFTPSNALVMFAPDRKDKLRFYRKDAPADLDFQKETFAKISTPTFNPLRITKCTPLVHILYDKAGRTWTTGCMTPVYRNGHHIGTWGTSVLLDDLLSTKELRGLPATDTVIVSAEGMLISHPGYTRQNQAGSEKLLDLTRTQDPKLQALWQFIRSKHDKPFLGHAPTLGAHVAMRKIQTPGWYLVTVQNDRVISSAALRAVARVAVTATLCLLLQTIAITLLIRRYVGQPLARLTDRTRSLTERFRPMTDPVRNAPRSFDEVEQLTLDFTRMANELTRSHEYLEQQVAERTAELQRANLELRQFADYDPLTGVPSRRRVVKDVEDHLTRRNPKRLYMVVIDIDHFKQLNDTYGHLAGDRILTEVARDLKSMLRDDDVFGRIGGEEFMALIESNNPQEVMAIAERLRCGIVAERRPFSDQVVGQVSISLGIANDATVSSFAELYAAADAALYEAKRRGRNCCVLNSQSNSNYVSCSEAV